METCCAKASMLWQHTSHVCVLNNICNASYAARQKTVYKNSVQEHDTVAAALRTKHTDTRGAHLSAAEVICVVAVVDGGVDSGACIATASVKGARVDRAGNIIRSR